MILITQKGNPIFDFLVQELTTASTMIEQKNFF